MKDRRSFAANGRVASVALQGQVEAERFVTPEAARIGQAVVDLLDAPNGSRDRQLLLGHSVDVLDRHEGFAFVQARRDGYVGYVPLSAVADDHYVTHRVSTLATHLYHADDFKSRDLLRVSFGAELRVVDERQKFFETPLGFVPKKHVRPLDKPFADPATIAQTFFGTPYLWGGNSSLGIDCSGLVQAGLLACGVDCPGDSDQQRTDLGQVIDATDTLHRGDLIFWKGHVGMMVDEDTMIHANAHHMAVVYEPLADATIRIKAQGDGEILMRRRVI